MVLHSRSGESLAAKKAWPFNELDNVGPVVRWPAVFRGGSLWALWIMCQSGWSGDRYRVVKGRSPSPRGALIASITHAHHDVCTPVCVQRRVRAVAGPWMVLGPRCTSEKSFIHMICILQDGHKVCFNGKHHRGCIELLRPLRSLVYSAVKLELYHTSWEARLEP